MHFLNKLLLSSSVYQKIYNIHNDYIKSMHKNVLVQFSKKFCHFFLQKKLMNWRKLAIYLESSADNLY